MGRGGPSYSEAEASEAIASSYSWASSLRKLGMCSTGGSWRVLRKYADLWDISTSHFDAGKARRQMGARYVARPLVEVLVESSDYPRKDVKRRLFDEGFKERRCELCGQGEIWRGKQMGLILDHINGQRDDHRLENLQIVCPNCAATLDTHCGRKNRISRAPRKCRRCEREFVPNSRTQRYCSRACGTRWDRTASRGIPKPETRKVERPPYEQLMAELEATSYVAVGRKYGVSDNAIRKWARFYERERERTSERR